VDQILKLLVLKHLPPFLVASDSAAGCGASSAWCHGMWQERCARSLIVRPHSAARSKEHNQGKSNSLLTSVRLDGLGCGTEGLSAHRGVSPDARQGRTAPE